MTVNKFIGDKVRYDKEMGQILSDRIPRMISFDLWDVIYNRLGQGIGKDVANEMYDKVGMWVTEAINEKLTRERKSEK